MNIHQSYINPHSFGQLPIPKELYEELDFVTDSPQRAGANFVIDSPQRAGANFVIDSPQRAGAGRSSL